MTTDEKAIRDLVTAWMKATSEGDAETVLSLMADDATFIVPGQEPFGKEAFAAAANDQANAAMEIDGDSEILDLTIAGDWAFMLSHLTVTLKSQGVVQMKRAGNTLTVLKKSKDRWLLHRDANLLVPVSK